jgi:flagellar FliJ protein
MNRKFKLQKVLEYRDLMLEREKSRLGAMQRQEQLILDEIRTVTLEIKKQGEELALANAASEFQFIPMYEKYIASLERKRRQTQEKLRLHRIEMDKQKQETVGAYRRKKIMDRLKEKHIVAYAAYTDKEEAKSTEDIVLTRKAGENARS